MKRLLKISFARNEVVLWAVSVSLITGSFLLFDRSGYMPLTASLIGVTSLIFNAKGHPFGQLLMVVFSALYGYLSLIQAYYGEMITYLGMTAPMALAAFITWIRYPYSGDSAEVAVNRIRRREVFFMLALTALVTLVFYFVLAAFDTAHLFLSTLSVTTSFIAVYLTFRRNPGFALAYAANDLVLVALWWLAAETDRSCLSVVICFAMFFINDLYGFFSWLRMQKRQIAREKSRNGSCTDRIHHV